MLYFLCVCVIRGRYFTLSETQTWQRRRVVSASRLFTLAPNTEDDCSAARNDRLTCFLHLVLPFSPSFHQFLLIFSCSHINAVIICFSLCSEPPRSEERTPELRAQDIQGSAVQNEPVLWKDRKTLTRSADVTLDDLGYE